MPEYCWHCMVETLICWNFTIDFSILCCDSTVDKVWLGWGRISKDEENTMFCLKVPGFVTTSTTTWSESPAGGHTPLFVSSNSPHPSKSDHSEGRRSLYDPNSPTLAREALAGRDFSTSARPTMAITTTQGPTVSDTGRNIPPTPREAGSWVVQPEYSGTPSQCYRHY